MAITIDADFPGGNVVLERIEGDTVYLHQDLRDSVRDWFYWCFRLRGAAGRVLHFCFTASRAIGTAGPAMSRDGGWTWCWLGTDCVVGNGFRLQVPADGDDLRLSFAMPYQLAHWQAFADRAGAAGGRMGMLCRTRRGRAVPLVAFGPAEARQRVLVTSRHHACEMMTSYALEGLADWLLQGAEAEARWLAASAQTVLIPFMDLDGVEAGDQGKARAPHDHNRDYDAGLYPSTRALRDFLPGWCAARSLTALDLHCPHIAGPWQEHIYLVGSADARLEGEQRRFSTLLEARRSGPLPIRGDGFLTYGQAWNTAANVVQGRTCTDWIRELLETRLAATLELPYATADGVRVDQASARAFGIDLGRALSVYLQDQ